MSLVQYSLLDRLMLQVLILQTSLI